MAGKRVRITFGIKREEDGSPVFFKSDGQRFAQPLTVKLQQDETYHVDVTIRPPIPVDCFRLHEEKIDLQPTSGLKAQTDPNALCLSGVWKTTGFSKTDKNKREQLKIFLSLRNSASLMTSLQCKFYDNAGTQHVRWGTKLTMLDFECVTEADGTLKVVNQQLA